MSRAKVDGYVPIPDVEKIFKDENSSIILVSPTELHPQALNNEETLLLMILDECINSPRTVIVLRTNYNQDDLTTELSSYFGTLLILPIMTTMVVLLVGATVMNTTTTPNLLVEDGIIDTYFPFVSTMLIWFASVISIRNRIMEQASFVVMDERMIYMTEKMMETAMDDIVFGIQHQINVVQSNLSTVLVAMQKKIDELSSSTNSTGIQHNHHQIHYLVVPDLSAIKNLLYEANDEIGCGAQTLKKAFATKYNIPNYFQSTKNYLNKVIIPGVVLICFFLQLGTTFFSILYLEHIMLYNTNPVDVTWRILEERKRQDIGKTTDIDDNKARIGEVFENAQDVVLLQTWPHVTALTCVCVSFGVAIFQIGLVYIFTGPTFLAGFVNDIHQRLSESVNHMAESVGFPTIVHSVLHDKMLMIKTALLQSFQYIHHLEKKLIGEKNASNSSPHDLKS